MSLRTDRVRAVGLLRYRPGVTNEEAKANGPRLVETIKSIPIIQKNLLKYELTFKTERLGTTLASDLGLQEADTGVMVVVEAETHEKIREALTSPEYRKIIAGALENATSMDKYHWFSAEFMTVIDK
ncbi:hypothetical protein R3P38DRAFT_3350718 [Favolaschia claudopus]|uniref:Stress-response A/B barrel domain-containing protein n=1 Tax=Favolaschia claudopus TaxID=2862362 RepID=A0AAW0C6S6_9AGAR